MHIRKDLIQNWTIIVTKRDIPSNYLDGDRAPNYGILGATQFEKQRIIIKEKAIEESLVHEIEHSFDYMNGHISNTPEFLMIFDSEMPGFRAHSNAPMVIINHKEFFAEVFTAIINKEERIIYAPKATEFIKNLIWS